MQNNTMTNLPQDWEVKKLGDIVKLKNGFAFKSNLFCNDGIPIIRIKNIQNENIILDDLVFCNLNDYKNNLDNYLIFKNDILIAMSGATTGKIGLYNLNNKAYLNQRIGLLRIDNNILRKYIFWFLYCNSEKNFTNAFGAAQPNLSTEQIHNIQIPLPPLQEQERIVGILDESFANIDESIKILEQDLLNLDELMQSALQKAFNPLKDNAKENYQLPQGWEWKSLEDIANIKGGKRLPKDEKLLDYKTPFPYIRVSDFQDDGTIDLHNIKFINEKTYNILSNYQIDNTNLYISIAGTIGKSGIIPKSLNGAILTENAIKLEYKNYNIYNKFMYYFTTSSCFKNQAIESTRIVAQPKLAISRLKTIQIPLPPLQEQEQIASYLDKLSLNIKDLKQNYQAQIKNLQELKKSLLDRAFKGRL